MTKPSESAIKSKILADRAEELRLNVVDCAINYARNPNEENKKLFERADYGLNIILDLIHDFNNI